MTLASALALCALRRARRGAAAAPLAALGAGCVVLALPLLLVRGGERAGDAAASFLEARPAAVVLLLPLVLAAVAAGATVTLLVPEEHALDPQLRASPVGRTRVVLASTVAPVLVATAAAVVLLAAAAIPFAVQLPGGRGVALALVAACASAGALGAALAEGALAAARRARHAGAALAVPLAVLVGGPLDGLARSLLDPQAVVGATLRAAVVGSVASAVWLWLVVRRPPASGAQLPRLLLPIPARPGGAWLVAALGRYGRRPELRRAAATGVVLGAAAAGAMAAAGAVGPTAVVLGAATALLGACAFPLAHHGLDLRARWLWLSRRGGGGAAVAAGAAAAAGLACTAVALVAAPAVLLTRAGGAALAGVAVASAAALGLALAVGVLLPWRGDRLGDRFASFAAFAAAALCASAAAGAAAEPALRLVPEPVFAVAVACVPAGVGLALAGRSFARLP